MKKITFHLAILMLASSISLTACSVNTAPEEKNDAQASSTEAAAEKETEPDVYEEGLKPLSEMKFDGAEFSILTRNNEGFEMHQEELTGESTSDAVYNRNLAVESMYDVDITVFEAGNWDNVTDTMRVSVLANDMLYDLVGQTDFKTYAIVESSLCGNWMDIPMLDKDARWWTSLANEEATINGKLYTITGDLCLTNMLYLNVFFYNADRAHDYGITPESLQNSVFEGKWTFDELNSIIKSVYEDTNGDGIRDAEDFYGALLSPNGTLDAWLTAFDQPLTDVSDDGHIEIVMFTDKTISALGKVNTMYYENNGSYNPGSWKDDDMDQLFKNDRGLFLPAWMNKARTVFSDMDSDYGILPYPKWDESQTDYYSLAGDQFTVLAFPINTPPSEYEFLGTITEALTILSSRDVAPEFYDSALKGRYSLDANTAKIVDIIMAGRCFAFAFQYGNLVELPYMFRNCIMENSVNIASAYQAKETMIGKQFEKIEEYYGLTD